MTREDDILDKAQEEIALINKEEQELIEQAADIIETLSMKDVGPRRFRKALDWLKAYNLLYGKSVLLPDVESLVVYPHPVIEDMLSDEEE